MTCDLQVKSALSNSGRNSTTSDLVHNLGAESEDVTGEYPRHLGLFIGPAQPDVVDECAVAAGRVHQEESVVLEDDQGMLAGQDLAVEKRIARIRLKMDHMETKDYCLL